MKITIPYTRTTIIAATIALILLTIGGILLGTAPEQTVPPAKTARPSTPQTTQTEDDVEVTVTYTRAREERLFQFIITLNTHTGDLSSFDAATNVAYRTQEGNDVAPQSVGGDRETHHRTITATFTNITLPGSIVLKNLRGVPERLFTMN